MIAIRNIFCFFLSRSTHRHRCTVIFLSPSLSLSHLRILAVNCDNAIPIERWRAENFRWNQRMDLNRNTKCSIYDSSIGSYAGLNRFVGFHRIRVRPQIQFTINFIGLLKWHWIDWCALLHRIEAINSSFVSIKTKYKVYGLQRANRQIVSECQSATGRLVVIETEGKELTRRSSLWISEIDARMHNARHRPRRHMKP